jgi:hypothetical protein
MVHGNLPPNGLSFTQKANNLARELRSDIYLISSDKADLDNGPDNELSEDILTWFPYVAVWDTGAMRTVITPKVADELDLWIYGYQKIAGVGAVKDATEHYVDMLLPNHLNITGIPVLKGILPGDIDVLIGMDIISQGDFAVTNVESRTVLSFRCPSLRTIDFTQEGLPSRNAPCPCGSGKKYKHCHGKTK